MSQITLTPESLDAAQIRDLAASLTDGLGEYGERYTSDQVQLALWRTLEDKLDEMLDDLDALRDERRFAEYLGKPSHFADPRAVRCADCGHPYGDHVEDYCSGNFPRTCSCAGFYPAAPAQITFTNSDPRSHDGLGELRWTAEKKCLVCGQDEFYITTAWYDGCCREQPHCINCDAVLIGLPVDADARRIVLAERRD